MVFIQLLIQLHSHLLPGLFASNKDVFWLFFFLFLIFLCSSHRLALMNSQLNERRASLFRPNSGQPAGPRQGEWTTHFSDCSAASTFFCFVSLDFFFFNFYRNLTWGESRTSTSSPQYWSVQGFLLTVVKWRFDHNRWFIRALSCQRGATFPTANDRGPQTPSLRPCWAKNWPVWWVHLDVVDPS